MSMLNITNKLFVIQDDESEIRNIYNSCEESRDKYLFWLEPSSMSKIDDISDFLQPVLCFVLFCFYLFHEKKHGKHDTRAFMFACVCTV